MDNTIMIDADGSTQHVVAPGESLLSTEQKEAMATLNAEFGSSILQEALGGDLSTSEVRAIGKDVDVTANSDGSISTSVQGEGTCAHVSVKIVTDPQGESIAHFYDGSTRTTTQEGTAFELGNKGEIRIDTNTGCPYIDVTSVLTKRVVF